MTQAWPNRLPVSCPAVKSPTSFTQLYSQALTSEVTCHTCESQSFPLLMKTVNIYCFYLHPFPVASFSVAASCVKFGWTVLDLLLKSGYKIYYTAIYISSYPSVFIVVYPKIWQFSTSVMIVIPSTPICSSEANCICMTVHEIHLACLLLYFISLGSDNAHFRSHIYSCMFF